MNEQENTNTSLSEKESGLQTTSSRFSDGKSSDGTYDSKRKSNANSFYKANKKNSDIKTNSDIISSHSAVNNTSGSHSLSAENPSESVINAHNGTENDSMLKNRNSSVSSVEKEHIRFNTQESTLSDTKSENTPDEHNNNAVNKHGNNAKRFYKQQKEEVAESQSDSEMCHNDTLNETDNSDNTAPSAEPPNQNDMTLEALEHIRDNAQQHLDNMTGQISNNADKYTERMSKLQEHNLNASVVRSKIVLERTFDVVTDEQTGESRKVVRYQPKMVSENIPAYSPKIKSMKYKALYHREGSLMISAIAQEGVQLSRIAAKKGFIHAAFVLADKVEIPTPLDSNKPLSVVGSAVKSSLLGAETVAVKLSEKATDKLISTAKSELEQAGAENDGYKAAKLMATLTAETASDIKDIVDYASDMHFIKDGINTGFYKSEDIARMSDRADEKFERRQEKLEYKQKKAQYELNKAQQRVDKYNSSDNGDTSFQLQEHEKLHTETGEKSRVQMTEKTTVTPSSEKSRADVKVVDENSNSKLLNEKKSSDSTATEKVKASGKTKLDKKTSANSTNNSEKSELHSPEKVKMTDKSHIDMSEKTTVILSTDKSRAETRSVNEFANRSWVENDLAELKARKKSREDKGKPHKYVAKVRKDINTETGQVSRHFEITRRELTVNERKQGLISGTASSLKNLANGEIHFGGKKDLSLGQSLSRKAQSRTISKVGKNLREQALRDGGDNDAVTAVDKTASLLQATGRTYDSAKSLLQPISNKVEDLLISGETRMYQYLSNHTAERTSMLQPKEEKPKKNSKSKKKDEAKKRQYKKQRRKVFQLFHQKEVKQEAFQLLLRYAGDSIKKLAGGVGIGIVLLLIIPILFIGGGSGITTGTAAFGAIISPCDDIDLTLSEQYWTELAQNLINDYRNFPSTHGGYNKYVANTAVSLLNHDPYKLLAYLSVACKDDNGEWNYESAKAEIESIFNEQYETYSQETIQQKNCVTTETTEYISNWYNLGSSTFASGLGTIYSENYAGYASTYYEVFLCSWYDNYTISDVLIDNGVQYEEPQTITYNNLHELYLEYPSENSDETQYEYWREVYQYQSISLVDYKILEYGIREKKSFDSIIDERVAAFDEEQLEFYGYYTDFRLGHQTFSAPVTPFNVIDYAGYNTDVNQTDGLDNSITVSTALGSELLAPCNGTVTITGATSIAVYNSSMQSTIYIDNVTVTSEGNVTKNTVIGKTVSDNIVITIVDKDGNYQNPYLLIDWS